MTLFEGGAFTPHTAEYDSLATWPPLGATLELNRKEGRQPASFQVLLVLAMNMPSISGEHVRWLKRAAELLFWADGALAEPDTLAELEGHEIPDCMSPMDMHDYRIIRTGLETLRAP